MKLPLKIHQSDPDSSSEPLDSASASLSPSLGRLTKFSSPPPRLLRPTKLRVETS